jgi:hypothetical protein
MRYEQRLDTNLKRLPLREGGSVHPHLEYGFKDLRYKIPLRLSTRKPPSKLTEAVILTCFDLCCRCVFFSNSAWTPTNFLEIFHVSAQREQANTGTAS